MTAFIRYLFLAAALRQRADRAPPADDYVSAFAFGVGLGGIVAVLVLGWPA